MQSSHGHPRDQRTATICTFTELRIKLFINLPEHISVWVTKDCEYLGVSKASFFRNVAKVAYGTGVPRCKNAPKYKLPDQLKPKARNRSPIQALLDPPDMQYLDAVGMVGGLSRSDVMILLILDWFDVPHVPPLCGLEAQSGGGGMIVNRRERQRNCDDS